MIHWAFLVPPKNSLALRPGPNNRWTDSVVIPLGEVVYYLATGNDGGGVESGLDMGGAGNVRVNVNGCP